MWFKVIISKAWHHPKEEEDNTGLEEGWIEVSSGWKSWLLVWREILLWRFVP